MRKTNLTSTHLRRNMTRSATMKTNCTMIIKMKGSGIYKSGQPYQCHKCFQQEASVDARRRVKDTYAAGFEELKGAVFHARLQEGKDNKHQVRRGSGEFSKRHLSSNQTVIRANYRTQALNQMVYYYA